MTQADRGTNTEAISIADLNTSIDGEPRVLDETLGFRLGFSRPRDIKKIIERSGTELETYGALSIVRSTPGSRGGRPTSAYYLNEPQSLLICMFSNTVRAAAVRKMLIDVFMQFRRGKEKPVKVQAHERRTSTPISKAISLARSADRLEKVADGFEPRVHSLSMMVVDGRPVVFDPADTDFRDGDTVVGFDWNGNLIVTPITQRSVEGWRPGGNRLVSSLPRVQGGIKTTPSIFAIGKVIMTDVPTQQAAQLPDHYRGRKTLYRDEILQLIGDGMENRDIAIKTGACYQTVTHWRRWLEDRGLLAA